MLLISIPNKGLYFSQVIPICRVVLFISFFLVSHSPGNWTVVFVEGHGKWNCYCCIKNNQFDEFFIYSHTRSNVILICRPDIVLFFCTRMIIGFWQIPARSFLRAPHFFHFAQPPLLFQSPQLQFSSTAPLWCMFAMHLDNERLFPLLLNNSRNTICLDQSASNHFTWGSISM